MTSIVATYRRVWPQNRYWRVLAKTSDWFCPAFVGAVLLLIVIGSGWLLWSRPEGWPGKVGFLGFLLIFFGAAASPIATFCTEIRLRDDGVCEFETFSRRTVRTHVAEITSVEEEVDEENDHTFYVTLGNKGSVWTGGLAGFEEFLARIEAMNPDIKITRKSR